MKLYALLLCIIFLCPAYSETTADAMDSILQEDMFSGLNQSEPEHKVEPKSSNEKWQSVLDDILQEDMFSGVDEKEAQGGDSWRDAVSGYRSGNTAYVYGTLVDIEDNMAVVKEANTNVRLGPSTEFGVIVVGQIGDKFRFVSRLGNWIEISLEEDSEGQNVESVKKWGTVRVNTRLNFRSAPWGGIIGKLTDGDKVEVLARDGEWLRVRADGKTGYIHKRYVELGDTIFPAPTEEPNPDDEIVSRQDIPDTSGRVVRRNGGVEIEGVMVQSQNRTDPFDPNGGRGQYPGAYCGPTSLQNVLAFYGVEKSRDYLALTNVGAGAMYQRGRGSAYAQMVAMCKHLGFSGTEQVWQKSVSTIRERVEQGRPQIVSVKGRVTDVTGRGYYTNGHIMTVVGVKDNGNVIVHDSAGQGRRRELPANVFMSIWRGFVVDVKR